MRSKLFALISLATILMAFIIGGCSGGGGGGGGGGSNSISYTGNTAPALVTDVNAQELVVKAFIGAEVAPTLVPLSLDQNSVTKVGKNISNPIFLPLLLKNAFELAEFTAGPVTSTITAVQTVTETIDGSCGGTVSYNLQVENFTGEFTGAFTFSKYCDSGITISGFITANGEINLKTDEIELLFITFSNLSAAEMKIQGDVSIDATATPLVIEIDYLAEDNQSGKVYWISNYVMLVTEEVDFVEVEVDGGGRFYDHDFGYIDISTTDPFIIDDGDENPKSGGLLCVGENNTKTLLTSVDNSSFRVEADTDGDDSFETDLGIFLWADLTF